MLRATRALATLAVILSIGWLAHATCTGIGVPYQNPTPELRAYEREQMAISEMLCLATSAIWVIAGLLAAVCGYVRRYRS